MRVLVERAKALRGSARVPGDKSISHRALIFSALSEGRCRIEGLSPGEDVRSTAACLRALGVEIALDDAGAEVAGVGLKGLSASAAPLDCGNSGTSMRLLSGVVAGAGVGGVLDGDESLRGRPMGRVLEPLRKMGARCEGRPGKKGDAYAPLRFEPGSPLTGVHHALTIASAQVKTCLLLAGLFARGETSVLEPSLSRDHTERMLRAFGAPLDVRADRTITLRAPERLTAPGGLRIPGDPSSAAFLVGAGLLVRGGELEVRGVDVNPTRAGFLRVLERMGATVERVAEPECAGDPVATLRVRGGGALRGTEIAPDEVPSLIDEIPLLAVVASQAEGKTVIRGASELRVKESDRLARTAQGLFAMGASVKELPDGLVIEGPSALKGAGIDAVRDHRIAMSFTVAGLCAEGTTEIRDAQWADISYPGFYALLGGLTFGAVRVA